MRIILDEGAFMPERAHELDAGYDLRTPMNLEVWPMESVTVSTGVHMEIPKGYVGFLKSKSGLNVKHDLTGEGVVDAGYCGSIVVKLYNHGDKVYKFRRGDKIIQIVLLPVYTPELEVVDEFENTERGSNGFGSTGR